MSPTTIQPIVSLLSESGPSPRDVLMVEEALLPALLLPDVPVVLRDVREPISILQRFLLQAAVDARTLDLQEAQQATSIPLVALRRLTREFAQAGLLVVEEVGERFTPNDDLCRRALASNRVELEKPGLLHFLFLPESDELIVLNRDDATRKFVTSLQACKPDAGYPSPALEGLGLREFLQSYLDRSAVAGLPSDFLRIELPNAESTDPASGIGSPMPTSVPAFRVAFTMTKEKERTYCRLKLLTPRKPSEVDLSAATAMLAMTVERSTLPRFPAASIPALATVGIPRETQAALTFESPVRATVPLDEGSAKQVSAQSWLTDIYAVRVHQPSFALTTRASVSFLAADELAGRMFAVDEAAQALLNAPGAPTPETLHAALERSGRGVQNNDVTERLWQRREFNCVHAIRVQEDLFHA